MIPATTYYKLLCLDHINSCSIITYKYSVMMLQYQMQHEDLFHIELKRST